MSCNRMFLELTGQNARWLEEDYVIPLIQNSFLWLAVARSVVTSWAQVHQNFSTNTDSLLANSLTVLSWITFID